MTLNTGVEDFDYQYTIEDFIKDNKDNFEATYSYKISSSGEEKSELEVNFNPKYIKFEGSQTFKDGGEHELIGFMEFLMNEDYLHLFNLITENVINHKKNPHEAIIKNRNLTGEDYVLVIGKNVYEIDCSNQTVEVNSIEIPIQELNIYHFLINQ